MYRCIFRNFLSNFRKETGISSIAIGNEETFVVKKSNACEGEGGAHYLLEHTGNMNSRERVFNDFINTHCDAEDEILSIG